MGLLEQLLARLRQPGAAMPQAHDPTDSPIPQQPIQRAPPYDRTTYRVKEGDTLQTIAKEVYGDPALSSRILQANRDRIGEPPALYPGLELHLP